MRIAGIAAIVSGGSSGLGAATAARLTARGASVVVFDRQPNRAESNAGGAFVQGDVTDEADVTAAIAAAAELGPLRLLVNCAGIGSGQRTVGRSAAGGVVPHDLADFRRVIDVNLIGTFNCMRLAAAEMASNPPGEECSGVVVNTASIAAYEGQVGQIAYAAAKAGIVGMTLAAARDLAPIGVRVNTIAPGMIDTPILETLSDTVRQGLERDLIFPRRPGRPDEFATLVTHLVENDFVNGETIRLDAAARMPARSR